MSRKKKKISLEINCNVTHSSSEKLSLLITGTELDEVIHSGNERSLLHVSGEALDAEHRQTAGHPSVSWGAQESTSLFCVILQTERQLTGNQSKQCNCVLSLLITGSQSHFFKLETYKAEYWVLIPFSLHFCGKTASSFCFVETVITPFEAGITCPFSRCFT